jgi:hypothetical protein
MATDTSPTALFFFPFSWTHIQREELCSVWEYIHERPISSPVHHQTNRASTSSHPTLRCWFRSNCFIAYFLDCQLGQNVKIVKEKWKFPNPKHAIILTAYFVSDWSSHSTFRPLVMINRFPSFPREIVPVVHQSFNIPLNVSKPSICHWMFSILQYPIECF